MVAFLIDMRSEFYTCGSAMLNELSSGVAKVMFKKRAGVFYLV